MTDSNIVSIVDKVFEPHEHYEHSKTCAHCRLLKKLKKELKEEIKKWIFDAKTCGHDLDKQDLDTSCQECLEDLTTLHDLIGDNKQ